MASSSSSKNLTLENYSKAPTTVTKTVRTTWTMEDSDTKVTLTDEETRKAKLTTDRLGNLRVDQEHRSKTTDIFMNRWEGTVDKVTHQAVTKGGAVFGREEAKTEIIKVRGPTLEIEDDDDYEYNQYEDSYNYNSDSDSDDYY